MLPYPFMMVRLFGNNLHHKYNKGVVYTPTRGDDDDDAPNRVVLSIVVCVFAEKEKRNGLFSHPLSLASLPFFDYLQR